MEPGAQRGGDPAFSRARTGSKDRQRFHEGEDVMGSRASWERSSNQKLLS
jgi:hypothetical protein